MSAPPVTVQLSHHRALSLCLHEPLQITRRLLNANRRFTRWVENWRNKPRSQRSLKRHVNHLSIPQLREFERLSQSDPRSRLIVSFHYGDFVYGLNYLMSQARSGRRCFVLSHKPGSRAYFTNIQGAFGPRAAGPESQLLLADTPAVALARLLREGGVDLVTFCDLPGGFGPRIPVHLLHRRAWLSCGAAVLAVVNRIPLLPVVCIRNDRHSEVRIQPQLEPLPRLDETPTQTIQRLTASLADLLTGQLQRDASQWRYLSLLPSYFREHDSAPQAGI